VSLIRKTLAAAGITCIRITGHPGSGKTELIEATLDRLPSPRRVAVIVVNPASQRDAARLEKLCGFVAHVDAAIPTAAAISRILPELEPKQFDLLLIETAGGLAPLQDLGQDATAVVFTVSGGDDKAAEYRQILSASSAVVLTKKDLLPLVKFDSKVFRADVESINPSVEVHELSSLTGIGMASWIAWIDRTVLAKRQKRTPGDSKDSSSDSFIG